MRKIRNTRSIIICLAIVAIIAILAIVPFGRSYQKDLAGETRTIQWEYVNLREKPNTTSYVEVLRELPRGTKVTLTGNILECLDGPTNQDHWSEVRLEDGTTGWVVTAAFHK